MSARLLAVAVLASLFSLGAGSARAQTTFSNTTPIAIPPSGAASPYPSQIIVSGMIPPTSKVTVSCIVPSLEFVDCM